MLDRIKLILKEKGLTSSVFADKVGVSRSAVSHILNKRNDPGMDTINKILKTFPDISPTWFINGLGPMHRHERVVMKEPDIFSPDQSDELPKQPVKTDEKTDINKYSPEIEVKEPEKSSESVEIKEINLPKITSKKIDKIIIFFSDKTFMTFISEE